MNQLKLRTLRYPQSNNLLFDFVDKYWVSASYYDVNKPIKLILNFEQLDLRILYGTTGTKFDPNILES